MKIRTLFQKKFERVEGHELDVACSAINHNPKEGRTPRNAVLLHFFDVRRTPIFYRRSGILPHFSGVPLATSN